MYSIMCICSRVAVCQGCYHPENKILDNACKATVDMALPVCPAIDLCHCVQFGQLQGVLLSWDCHFSKDQQVLWQRPQWRPWG